MLPPVEMRICCDCGESKPREDFHRKRAGDDDLRQKHCKTCSRDRGRAWAKANPEKVRAQKAREWARMSEEERERHREEGRTYQQSPEGKARRAAWEASEEGVNALAKAREYRRTVGRWKKVEKVYGLTREQHDELLARQGNTCAICALPMERIHIDHDHATGEVRGLLCPKCNQAIGLLQDSADIALAAAHYLKNGGSPSFPR